MSITINRQANITFADPILGLLQGEDTVVLHASLKRLFRSRDDCSAERFARGFERLSRAGITVLVPTFTLSYPRTKSYDDLLSKSETGALGDIALASAGFYRTPSRMYSFAVAGPRSDEFLNCRVDTAFSPGTSVAKLADGRTLVVMLGAPWDACTVIHHTEEQLQVPYREYVSWAHPSRVLGAQQPGEFRAFVRKIVPRTVLRFDRIRAELQVRGSIRSALVGSCHIEAANGKQIHEVASERIASDPYFFVDVVA